MTPQVTEYSYILRDAGFKTTSLGISPSGVLDIGGVLVDDGGNPGGGLAVPATGGVLVVPGSIPAARKRSSKAAGSGNGVEVELEGVVWL